MPSLPDFDIHTQISRSPHIVILGAGASKAAFPNGDANGRYAPLMFELVKVLELEPLFRQVELSAPADDFEAMYDEIVSSKKHQVLVKKIELKVRKYFSSLKLPDEVTIYDYLVLSLREKDIIATFNWDPFLALAWQRNSRIVKLPQIIFLHGNVKIGICKEHRVKNFLGSTCSKCRKPLDRSRLLYPVAHKDYNLDPFINSEWDEFKTQLKQAYFLTIFGYSAPTTDIEARELMLNIWKKNATYELAEIEIIDIKPKRILRMTWQDFFCREHYRILKTIRHSYLFRHPRRSCEALAMATLQNDPWINNPFPRTKNLAKIQKWARVLWQEETEGKLSGKKTNELGR